MLPYDALASNYPWRIQGALEEGDPENVKKESAKVQLLYFLLHQLTVVCPPNLFTTTFPDQMTIWDCFRAHNRSDAAQAMT